MMRSRTQTRKRNGFTLIELSAVITVSAAMLAVASVLVINLQRMSTSEQNAVESTATRIDVARQFRRDVHQANKATLSEGVLPDGGQQLILTGDRNEVRYSYADGVLRRRVGEGIEQRSQLKPYDVNWTVTDRLVRLQGRTTSANRRPPWTIDAALAVPTTADDVTGASE